LNEIHRGIVESDELERLSFPQKNVSPAEWLNSSNEKANDKDRRGHAYTLEFKHEAVPRVERARALAALA
jgi:hypothetical protein